VQGQPRQAHSQGEEQDAPTSYSLMHGVRVEGSSSSAEYTRRLGALNDYQKDKPDTSTL